mgnify:CR=1 FL=1
MLKKKITKILVGTNNIGKLREIKGLLPKKLKVYSTSDFKVKSPVENGKTFEEAKAEVLKGIELTEFACSMPQIIHDEIQEVSKKIVDLIQQKTAGVVRS